MPTNPPAVPELDAVFAAQAAQLQCRERAAKPLSQYDRGLITLQELIWQLSVVDAECRA